MLLRAARECANLEELPKLRSQVCESDLDLSHE